MAEYIEREAAIEQFRKSLDGGYVLTDDAQTTHILHSIPAADVRPVVPKWVPVTERLPDDRVEVLVSSGMFAPLIEVAFYDGLFYSAWDGETEIAAVTHWMPLPEPPKEE